MKIVNIFGLVVAVHIAVLLMIFAIPGCRTTARPGEPAAVANETPSPMTSSPIQPAREMTAADLNPPLAARSPSGAGSTPSVISPVSASGGRVSPSRPDSAPAAVHTTAAAVPTMTPYTVVRGDSLWNVAKKHGTTVQEIAAANNMRADAPLQIGKTLMIPSRAAATSPASTPAATGAGNTSGAAPKASGGPTGSSGGDSDPTPYVIRSGDTLGAIARKHKTTVPAIKAMNNLRSDLVRVGDTLLIPQPGTTMNAASTAAPAPAAATAATQNRPAAATGPATSGAATTSGNLVRAGGGSMKHVVAQGESLQTIARNYNIRVGDLALANNIADPSRIRPGQELIVPGVTDPAASRPAVPTQYPSSFDQARGPAGVIYTEDPDNVPVIRVEENVPTIRIDPAPPPPASGNRQPSLFN